MHFFFPLLHFRLSSFSLFRSCDFDMASGRSQRSDPRPGTHWTPSFADRSVTGLGLDFDSVGKSDERDSWWGAASRSESNVRECISSFASPDCSALTILCWQVPIRRTIRSTTAWGSPSPACKVPSPPTPHTSPRRLSSASAPLSTTTQDSNKAVPRISNSRTYGIGAPRSSSSQNCTCRRGKR